MQGKTRFRNRLIRLSACQVDGTCLTAGRQAEPPRYSTENSILRLMTINKDANIRFSIRTGSLWASLAPWGAVTELAMAISTTAGT